VRQGEIDETDGVCGIAGAQRVSGIGDLGHGVVGADASGATGGNDAIEDPGFGHLQRLLRLAGAAGDQGVTGGVKIGIGPSVTANAGGRQRRAMAPWVSAVPMLLALFDSGSESPTPGSWPGLTPGIAVSVCGGCGAGVWA
jgi:hypothetical protein